MAGQSFTWLLPVVLLVILGRPLDTPGRPAGDPRISTVLAEAPEQRDEAPEQRDEAPGTPLLGHVAAFLDLLATGVSLSWRLCRWLRRRWGQVREGGEVRQVG